MSEMIGVVEGVLRKSQGNRRYLFGTISSDKVKNLTFVPVIETSRKTYVNELMDKGYQRPGSSSRMRSFAKFLRDNPNSVVPPVLLSGRGAWVFKKYDDATDVGKLMIAGRAAVIDGQHRLGGFVHLYEENEAVREISFILLPDLDVDDEKKEFIVVNNSQKGVPRTTDRLPGGD